MSEKKSLFEESEAELRPPSPRLAKTLAMGLNYSFEQAIADLVDNSISADAKNIWIYIDRKNGAFKFNDTLIAVVDDGHGMSLEKLTETLEYGYDSADTPTNLGAFGLGMKTAATSQSWVLAVATRDDPNADFSRRAWDIPWVDSKGDWQLRKPREEMFPDQAVEKINGRTGTIVLLPDLTRMKANINTLSEGHQRSGAGSQGAKVQESPRICIPQIHIWKDPFRGV